MKKIAKKSLIAILIFSLVLSAFAGCSGITLDEEYGFTMTDKTVTYDSESHDMKIAVDNSLLVGKNYTVTYASGNKALTNPSFKEVGTYPVTATVTIEGEDAFTLDATMTIAPVELNLEIGDLSLRQGQGISSLGNPRDLFEDAGFVGDDTETSLGSLKFEIYDGSTKVTDLSKLKPSTSANKGYKVKIVAENTSTNYKVTFKEGELFVMTGGDFDVASSLKKQIATVPTSTTINEMNYSEMRAFVSSASSIIKDYPKTTEVQRKMSGSVNITEVEALYEIAKDRVNTVYKLEDDMESSAGSVIFLGVSHAKNEARDEDDEDYIDDFEGAKSKSRETAEVGDEVSFAIQIDDLGENKFLGCYVKDLFLDANVFQAFDGLISRDTFLKGTTGLDKATAESKSVTYLYGGVKPVPTPSTDPTTPTDKDYGLQNTGTTDGVNISTNLLGKLDGFTSIDFKPLVGESYVVGLYSDNLKTPLTKENMETELNGSGTPDGLPATFDPKTGRIYGEEIISFRITGHGDTAFEITDLLSKPENYENKHLIIGQEYEVTIMVNDGYNLLEIEMGDEIILPQDMDDDSFKFTFTEEHLTGDILKIIPRFTNEYSFTVMENGYTMKNENEAGFYDGDFTAVTLDGVNEGRVPTMDSLGMLGIQLDVADFYQVTGLEIIGTIWDETKKQFVSTTSLSGTTEYKKYTETLLEDILSSHNNTLVLEMGEGDFNFKQSDATPIEIVLNMNATFPVTATAVFDGVETPMSGSNGEFISKYGEVNMWNNYEDRDSFNTSGTMVEGDDRLDFRYYLTIASEDGYVPVGIKVNGAYLAAGTDIGAMDSAKGEMNRNMLMSRGTGTSYIMKTNTEETTIAYTRPSTIDKSNTISFRDVYLDAGEELNIEIEYVSYYDIQITPRLDAWKLYAPNGDAVTGGTGPTKYEIGVGKILDLNGSGSLTDVPSAGITLPDSKGKLVADRDSAIIAVKQPSGSYTYYVYGAASGNRDEIPVTIKAGGPESGGNKLTDRNMIMEIGNFVDIEDKDSDYSQDPTIEDVIEASGGKSEIKPGDKIEIEIECEYESVNWGDRYDKK